MAPGGYAWWYLDALSDDRSHGITLIAFIGSVFSPYYAWARRRGRGDPLDHCAVNIGLYSVSGKRWAMTERGRGSVHRDATSLSIGPSALRWEANGLIVDLDEVAVPLPLRIRGQVRLTPHSAVDYQTPLDERGAHRWRPIAPSAHVEVCLQSPGLSWSGDGYFDSNSGDEPLESAIRRWDWSRASVDRGSVVLYDIQPRSGARNTMALHVDNAGQVHELPAPAVVALPKTLWRVTRGTRSEGEARILRTLEDTPFYVRSTLATRLLGQSLVGVHESLDLDRFRSPIVQAMLPFRMPRRRGPGT